jgi:hypothetical protein
MRMASTALRTTPAKPQAVRLRQGYGGHVSPKPEAVSRTYSSVTHPRLASLTVRM